MSAIHGVASYFVPGLGQMIGGDKKEGAKYMGKSIGSYAALGVASGASTFLLEEIYGTPVLGRIFKKAAEKVNSKAGKSVLDKIGKALTNPKVLKGGVLAFAALGVAAGITGFINHIKSVIQAGKIEKNTTQA